MAVRIGVLVAGVVVALAPPAHGAGVVSMRIGPRVDLVDGGAGAVVDVRARCGAGLNVLEAFVYVVQDGRTSQFAPVPVTCDGRWHQAEVRAAAVDFVFSEGPARVSGYLLVSTAQGSSVSPTREVQVRS